MSLPVQNQIPACFGSMRNSVTTGSRERHGDILSFVSVEVKRDENGVPCSSMVNTEENIAAAAAHVGWLSPIPSYGIPIGMGEDAFLEAHIEVSRKRGVLDGMRRDIKGTI